jgi:glycosyltransferase involved in cell wall biosynthesis
MKVLFTARANLFAQPGGDTRQVVQTAEALRQLGVEVDIQLRGEKPVFSNYDLIHFFNAGRPADIAAWLPKIKQPLVVSSIWVDYSEWDDMQKGARGRLARTLGQHGMEYLKTLARGFKGTDRFPGWHYLLNGQKKSMQGVLNNATRIIASSDSEKKRLHKSFGTGDKTAVIPLGLPVQLTGPIHPVEREGVIAVGRIEGLKNQLNLIKAANGANWNLKIIGKPALNQMKYYRTCQLAAGSNVAFAGWLNAEHLLEAYQKARVLVLPSYFETFGLVALEGLANGCNIVLSDRPDMNAIFGDKATFCNPNNPDDIRTKIDEALHLPPPKFTPEERQQYSWQHVAEKLYLIYQASTQ